MKGSRLSPWIAFFGVLAFISITVWYAREDGGDVRRNSNLPVLPEDVAVIGGSAGVSSTPAEMNGQQRALWISPNLHVEGKPQFQDPGLESIAVLKGFVVESRSQLPVPGVSIRLIFGGPVPGGVKGVCVSDESGAFYWSSPVRVFLRHIAIGSSLSTAGSRHEVGFELCPGVVNEINLEVSSGVAIHGTVLTDQGLPVDGAVVHSWNTNLMKRVLETKLPPDRVAIAGPDGGFVLEHMGGDVIIHASAHGLISKDYAYGTVEDLSKERGQITLVMRAPCTLTGVVWASDGTRVSNCRLVAMLSSEDARNRQVGPFALASSNTIELRTDEAGRFRFDDLIPGRIRLVAEHSQWARHELTVNLPQEEIAVILDAGIDRSGIVQRWSGFPAKEARIQLTTESWTREAISDESGYFELRHLPRFEEGILSVHDNESAMFSMNWADFSDSTIISLEEPLSIDGLLLDATGVPISRAIIQWRGDRELIDPQIAMRRVPWRYFGNNVVIETDESGRFSLGRLYNGRYSLTYRNPADSFQIESWQVEAGLSEVILRIGEKESSSVALRGTVVDQSGVPIDSFKIAPIVIDQDGRQEATKIYAFHGEGGAFEITSLASGTKLIMIQAHGFRDVMLEPAFYPNGETLLSVEMVKD